MLHCFFIWNLPDVHEHILKSYLVNSFGNYYMIDIFPPGRTGRNHNRGCCKIILNVEHVVRLNLFCLTPFDTMPINLSLSGAYVLIKRWRKNDFGDKARNFDVSGTLASREPSLIFDEFEDANFNFSDEEKLDDIDCHVKFLPSYSDIVVCDSIAQDSVNIVPVPYVQLEEKKTCCKNLIKRLKRANNDFSLFMGVCLPLVKFLWSAEDPHAQIDVQEWKSRIVKNISILSAKDCFERPDIFGD